MSERWAHCASCGRWFFCGGGAPADSYDCPVCLRPSHTVREQPPDDDGPPVGAAPG